MILGRKGKGNKPKIIKIHQKEKSDISVRNLIVVIHQKEIAKIKHKMKIEKNPFKNLELQVKLCLTQIDYNSSRIVLLNSLAKEPTSLDPAVQKQRALEQIKKAKAKIKTLGQKLVVLKQRQKIKVKKSG